MKGSGKVRFGLGLSELSLALTQALTLTQARVTRWSGVCSLPSGGPTRLRAAGEPASRASHATPAPDSYPYPYPHPYPQH